MSVSLGTETLSSIYDEARKYLGRDEGTPIPRDEVVEQAEAEGYDRSAALDALNLLVERGDFVRDDDGVRPAKNPTREAGSSLSGPSNPRLDTAQDDDRDGLPNWRDIYDEARRRAGREPWEYVPEDALRGVLDKHGLVSLLDDGTIGRSAWIRTELPPDDTAVPEEDAERARDDESEGTGVFGYYYPSGDETRVEEFRRFHELLTDAAPDGYTPYYFRAAPASKGPAVEHGSWKDEANRLSFDEAVAWMKEGGNVGVAGTPDDTLVNVDIDDDEETTPEDLVNTLRAVSRSRAGFHAWYFNPDGDVPNVPTDEYGEIRADWQYVVAPGSFVASSSAEIPEDEYADAGYYTVESEDPVASVSFDELPDVFHEVHEETKEENDEVEERTRDEYTPENTTGNESAVFDVTAEDVARREGGSANSSDRWTAIWHGSGTSANMSVSDEGKIQCWRHNVSHGGLQALAVLSDLSNEGCRRLGKGHVHSSVGPCSLKGDSRLVWYAWHYAKQAGYVPDDDPVPYRALRGVAVEDGVVEEDELVERDRDGGTYRALPDAEAYNEALDHIRDEYGLEPGRPRASRGGDDAERHDVFDTETVEEAGIFENHTERKRHLRKRGKLPSTPEVRRRIDETVKDRMKRGKTTVVDTPTSSGKSHTVATTPWTGCKDVTDGQPVIHLHKTKPARRDAYEKSRDAGVETRELVGRKDERRGCPVARGDLDGDVELDGVAPSRWIDAACKNKGLPFSLVHAEAVRRVEEKTPELLDDLPCPDCPPVVQHEGVPRDDDGNPSVDVIHATHQFAYVSSYLSNCNVVVDEQPDYTVDLSRDRIRRGVTAFLKEVDAPLDTFERLLVGRGNEHLEVGSDIVEDALDREPSRSWYFDCDDAHALAPALARAVWYARDVGNQRKKARVYHEPPRFNDEDGGVGVYVTLVLDETPDETDDATVWTVPNFGAARSLLGLDARPSMEMWQLNTTPDIGRVPVLNPEERRNWRFYERGLRVVQVGDATRPAGKNGRYFDEDGERAVVENLVERYGDKLRTAGTAKAVEDDLVEILQQERGKHGYVPEEVEALHYGEEKSRNVPAFEGASVGYVTHCIDPGDGPVLDAVAARGLNARPERSGECDECDGDGCHGCDGTGYKRAHGRGFVGEDADKAADILGSVRENHVAQMVGRYARNPEDDEVSVVFVRTDAVPDDQVDAKVKDVVWTFGEKQRAVKDAVEELDSPTAREIHDEVRDEFDDGVTKRHVEETLRKLEVCGYAERDEGVGAWGADVWATTDEDGVTETGVVDLGRNDANVQEITNSGVWDNYTWEFVNLAPNRRVEGTTDELDASRPDTGGVDPGGNSTLDAFGAD